MTGSSAQALVFHDLALAAASPEKTMTVFSAQGLVFLCASLAVAITTIELVRRRYLRESYAMLWLMVSAILTVFALFPSMLAWISGLLHLYYLTTVFLICFLFLVAIVMQYSVVLSRRAEENRQMVQRLAILQERIERLEGRMNDGAGSGQ